MRSLRRIATMGFYLGATIFGGVGAAYPVLRTRAAELGEISPAEVDRLYALSVFMPGPSFINLWGAICGTAGGFVGGLVGQVSLLIPAFLLVILLPLTTRIGYVAEHTAGALNGAIWATVGLLLATGADQVKQIKSSGRAVAVLALLIALFVGIHPTLILIGTMLGGALYSMKRTAARQKVE